MTRVGIVGGGLAGMSAALRAADAGTEVVLLERRPFLGGLTTSIERRGVSFDNGQHVFLRCCSAYRDFIQRIGATEQVHLQARLSVPVLAPVARRATIARNSLPAPFHLVGSLARYRHLSVAERLRLLGAVTALRRLDIDDPTLDARSFGDWLTQHHQSDGAIDRLWDLIVRPTLNVGARDASLALAAMVFQVGLLDERDAGDIGWSKIPLIELHGTLAAQALSDAGVEVVCNATVSSIDRRPDGRWAVRAGDRVHDVDAVIVATPARVAASLGAVDASVADALGASPIVNVHLVLDRRVTDLEFAAAVDSPIEFIFDRTASSGVEPGQQCLSISLSAADEHIATPTDELVASFFRALGELMPAARAARLVDGFVTRERAATFRASPGVGAHRPGAATAEPGVFLAGAWCHTGWPATMEGAVRSGNECADAARAFASGTIDDVSRRPERIVR
ncbi:MAG TPA: hydroxysqualene dehydroxylase HpnE [Acidimicrobiales bacterium]|nr:hydroxysqualene dehydroxylase HpnE [Acidimicrobiales bacterium]